ncbi:MAG: hypothetical protein CSA44_01790 [Gammaproteobacteria bacterium]|nr:MAG: hypothetical protein CSA44_01790 [Gammaproteobacteria bacterium]
MTIQKIFSIFSTTLSIAYPFIVWLIFTRPDMAKAFAWVLLTTGVIRLALAHYLSTEKPAIIPLVLSYVLSISMILIGGWVIKFGTAIAFQIYPLLINIGLFTIFSYSLRSEQSIIERFALLYEKNITTTKRAYMRNITRIWCLFFVINFFISAFTWLAMSTTAWAIYNGIVSYVLIGVLLTGEYLYRRWIFYPKNKNSYE